MINYLSFEFSLSIMARTVRDDLKVEFEAEGGEAGNLYKKLWEENGKLLARFGDPDKGEVKEIKAIYAIIDSYNWNSSRLITKVELEYPVPRDVYAYRLIIMDGEEVYKKAIPGGTREVVSLSHLERIKSGEVNYFSES